MIGLTNLIIIQIELIEEVEEENIPQENTIAEVDEADKQKFKDIKKNLFINTKINGIEACSTPDRSKQDGVHTDHGHKNSMVPTQNNEEDSYQQIDLNNIGTKIQYPPKNMILNEMPSPISPPNIFKLRPKLQLRIEKSSGSQIDNQSLVVQTPHVKYPKEIVQLIEYFPKDMFSCYLNNDKEEIEKGMSKRVYKLGLFLLFGEDTLNQPAPQQILQKLNEITQKQIFHQWFINMIKLMISENESDRPTLKQLSQIIQKNFKISN